MEKLVVVPKVPTDKMLQEGCSVVHTMLGTELQPAVAAMAFTTMAQSTPVATMSIGPQDVVVIRAGTNPHPNAVTVYEKHFPAGTKFLVLSHGVALESVSEDDMRAAGWVRAPLPPANFQSTVNRNSTGPAPRNFHDSNTWLQTPGYLQRVSHLSCFRYTACLPTQTLLSGSRSSATIRTRRSPSM